MTLEEVQAAEANNEQLVIKLTSKTGVVFEFEVEIISTELDEGFVTIALDGQGFTHKVRPEDLET